MLAKTERLIWMKHINLILNAIVINIKYGRTNVDWDVETRPEFRQRL